MEFTGSPPASVEFPDTPQDDPAQTENEADVFQEEVVSPAESAGCSSDHDCALPADMGPCTAVICDEGSCIVEPASDGSVCEPPGAESNLCVLESICDKGQCVSLMEVMCDSEDPCVLSTCEPTSGNCIETGVPNCITPPSCIIASDCIGALDVAPCVELECVDGLCAVGEDSEDGSMCFLSEWEDAACIIGGSCESGACEPLVPNCDDGDPCTIDSCDPMEGGCVSVEDEEACGNERGRPNGTPCGPDVECESGVCEDGVCLSSCLDGSTCPEGTYCDIDGYCMSLYPMGSPCDEDAQCASGACEGALFNSKTCVCLDHNDCFDGEYCGTFGVNECLPVIGICDDNCSTDKSCGTDAICAGAPIGQCVISGSSIVGQLCCRDAQCASDICGSDGICQCSDDSDCPTGACDTSLFGANICVECTSDNHCGASQFCAVDTCIPLFPVGSQCDKDKECLSDICGANGLCQCATSDQCGPDLICSTALFGANACVECEEDAHCGDGFYCDVELCKPRLIEGSTCDFDSQCFSDLCGSNDVCQCKDNAHCADSLICSTAVFGSNICVECENDDDCGSGAYCSNELCHDQLNVGEDCNSDHQCLSDLCEGGSDSTCVCHEDSDCPGDMVCDTAFFGANQCLQCISHGDCGDGLYCDDGVCGTEGPVGTPCNADYECLSDSCQGDTFGEGNCACLEDMDCPGEAVCDKNVFTSNECVNEL